MSENQVDVKLGRGRLAVVIRACEVTGAVDTILFEDVEAAQLYCRCRWNIPLDSWEPYLVAQDPASTMKLNGEGVQYCGWKHHRDETETIHIHLQRLVVEF